MVYRTSGYSLTLNISEIAKDTAIVTMKGDPKFLNGTILNDLE